MAKQSTPPLSDANNAASLPASPTVRGRFRRRLQLSLSNLVLLVLTAGSITLLALTDSELKRAREEIVALKQTYGILELGDRRSACVMRLPDPDEDTWKWQVFVPEGRSVRIAIGGDASINADSKLPPSTWEHTWSATSETIVSLQIKLCRPTDAAPYLSYYDSDFGLTQQIDLPQGSVQALASSQTINYEHHEPKSTQVISPDGHVVLVRVWRPVHQDSPSKETPASIAGGVTVWLELVDGDE